MSYYGRIEVKIINYQDYLSALYCEDCSEKIISVIDIFKQNVNDNINKTKELIMQTTNDVIRSVESKNILRNFLDSLTSFKEDLLQKIDSKEMEWMDAYHKSVARDAKMKVPKWPIFGMIFGAIFCLTCSTVFHLFSCHGEKASSILNRIDYAGIAILISGSCYPPYYYFFYCSSFFSVFYISFVTIFAVAVFVCSLKSDFTSPQKRNFRGTLFGGLGISTAVPFLHILLFGPYTAGMINNPTLRNWFFGGISYLVGVAIYMWRMPEKYWPGKFDFWGNSHNIFHVNVIIGVIFHYMGSIDSYHDRLGQVCY